MYGNLTRDSRLRPSPPPPPSRPCKKVQKLPFEKEIPLVGTDSLYVQLINELFRRSRTVVYLSFNRDSNVSDVLEGSGVLT